MKLPPCFLLFLLLNFQLSAQEKWTLNDCISYGIKNNLQVHQAILTEKMAEQSLRQSRWNLLPGASAGAGAGMNFGRSVDPNTNDMINTAFFNNYYTAGTSFDLFRGFSLQNQISYQKFRKQAAENNRLNAVDDLAFSIMNAFFDVIYFEELLKIATEQKELSALNLKKTEALVAAGLKSQADLLEVKANLEKEELFCIQTGNNLASALISLRKTMNTGPGKTLELLPPEEPVILATPALPDPSGLFAHHISWSPQIRQRENEWQASLKSIRISQAAFFPSIRLQAAYNTGFYETNKDANRRVIPFAEQIRNNRNQSIGAYLSIPLFSKQMARIGVTQSRLASEEAQTRLEQARQNLFYNIVEDCNKLEAAIQESSQAEKQFEADKLAFEAAQKKYTQGLIGVIELYTVQNRLGNAASQLLRAKLTYEIQQRVIDFYSGKRFWEENNENENLK